MKKEIDSLKKEILVQQDIIKDFLQETLNRDAKALFYEQYFSQHNTSISDPVLAEQMHKVSEDVREVTLNMQEDARIMD